jgi:tRNA(His) 5'-end guanylyltransferase
MRIDDLDDRMRAFETAMDPSVLPGIYMVARLDGRNFTRLTKEVHPFEAPFDFRFHDFMLQTAEHLMGNGGVEVVYAFTQSDEISLLFGRGENSFGRKLRKLLSVLSGEVSAWFSLLLGSMAVFDCRVAQLPTEEYVID